MRPVITPEESARLDAESTEPVDVLMDRAGYGIAVAVARMGATYGTRVLALAGPGNNGGDAYVAARYLRGRGVDIEVRALKEPAADTVAGRAAAAAKEAGVPVRPLGAPEPADLVIDGLFGAGFRGTLPAEAAAWAERPQSVLAVDLPSGLDGADGTTRGPAFTAERTVTFQALKVGHLLGEGPDRCGSIEIVDIGLSGDRPTLLLCEDEDALVPVRSRQDHKWSSGAVLLVGGSPGMAGAIVLAARAALRAGAGYVRVACHPDVASTVIAAEPSVTTTTFAAAHADLERFDVVAAGPGLGDGTDEVAGLLGAWEGPLVLDADAIGVLDDLGGRKGPTVITPHGGEFSRAAGEAMTLDAIERFAEKSGAIVLAKGNPTLVVGEERWVVTTGGPELATLGTGDVLTGMIAAFAARGLDLESAVRSAAYRHGLAGAALADDGTVTASALADEIGRWSA